MKKFFIIFSTVKKELRYILYGDLLFVLIYNIWLLNIPEKISWGYEIGVIIHTLCLSYIAAFIFFFLNIHHSQFKSRVKGRTYVQNKISKISRLNMELHSVLKKQLNSENEEELEKRILTEEQIKTACTEINVKQQVKVTSTVDYVFGNWFQYFNYMHKEIMEVISSLAQQNLYNDEELFEILFKIEFQFDAYLNRFKGNQVNVKEDSLNFFKDGIIGFSSLTEELIKYREKLDKYS
ncbi:hypothetical protein [Priestia megaterium]|uniref:hypothetical protein n=1 Tax=Priestia megaterium TaxID=1404 RepID=UPI001374EF02|nr:hypothetical protein [Priestia megaterium]